MRKALLHFLPILFVLLTIQVFAQATDTLVSFDDLEFSELPVDSMVNSSQQVAPDSNKADSETLAASVSNEQESLWTIFMGGLIGGFAALLMPCIFPMLPMTVSFFTKSSANRRKAIANALLYGVSIIVIYVALGLLVTLLFGSDALNALSTNGLFNFLFFVLLVVFGASFLGAFEITLPSSWVNKMDQKSDAGGVAGIFFMAATLAVVSFSCTGPIIGTLLVQAASKGALLGPAIGMFGFSLALALPFALFALFPSAMKALPKSGGWLNSVKVVLGLLELAFALKFLSNVDLAYHWGWLDREVFLALWIAIFGLMALYLLGLIRFAHDSAISHLSVLRTFFAIVVLAFVFYLIPGMWGAPLKSVSAFLPPSATQDFDLSTGVILSNDNAPHDGVAKKYAEIFHERGTPKGFDPYYDYDQALEIAKQENKPILIDFTGWNCVNCRKMEANVWTDPRVKELLNKEFIMAELFVDDKTELAKAEQYVSEYSGKKINTIGKKWSDFQASSFNSNSQPLYAIVDPEGKILVPPTGADYDVVSYLTYLQSGLDTFKAK